MSDSISRQAVLNTLDSMDTALDEDRTVEKYKELLTECIKVLPSAEKKGEWIIDKERLGYWISTCSVCGHILHGNEVLIYKPKFCSNCGARMEGSE